MQTNMAADQLGELVEIPAAALKTQAQALRSSTTDEALARTTSACDVRSRKK
jgi:hypothetical protein